jgi:hypothetical protein
MKKQIIFGLIALISCYQTCNAQLDRKQLMQSVTFTLKDLLDLRLKILAAQMSSGSFYILDMGNVGFPVSIEINDTLKVIFKIRGSFNKSQLSIDEQKSVVEQSMKVVDVGISELFRYDFRRVRFDHKKDLIGYWYISESYYPSAKWENGKLIWLK